MVEKKAEFVYTNREVVKWLFDSTEKYYFVPCTEESAHEAVEKMRGWGWGAKKILDRCADLDLSPRFSPYIVSLADLIYYNHPILQELDEGDIRVALDKMALIQIARYYARVLEARVKPTKINTEMASYYEERARTLWEFHRRLIEEPTPALDTSRK